MCIDCGVSGSASQILAITVWNMLTSFWVPEALSEPKVNDIHKMLLLLNTYQEVIWFDISVQEVARVDEL